MTDKDFQNPAQNVLASDEELEAVTGGGNAGGGMEACGCAGVGFGFFNDGSLRCNCVAGGGGIDK